MLSVDRQYKKTFKINEGICSWWNVFKSYQVKQMAKLGGKTKQ